MNISPPIIRLEVEHMKHAMLAACSQYLVQLDEQVQAAVQKACTVENITRVVEQAADDAISKTIKEEIESFFRFGDGRRVIKDAVEKQLSGKKLY